MKIKCEHCGSYIPDTADKCPNCGATNEHMMRSAQGVPKTIEELQAFCAAHGMDLKRMRFFIGEDYRGARAFGIYRDGAGNVVVYKNKADGTRAIRYEGSDEAYGVNELYQKLKSEVQQRQGAGGEKPRKPDQRARRRRLLLILAGLAVVLGLFILLVVSTPDTGYYSYGGQMYYSTAGDWYAFDTATESWGPTSASGELTGSYRDYWQGSSYSDDYGTSDFSQSEYYTPSSDSSDSDWDDSDWDYDYDSWDSGGTDWSSDW